MKCYAHGKSHAWKARHFSNISIPPQLASPPLVSTYLISVPQAVSQIYIYINLKVNSQIQRQSPEIELRPNLDI